MRFAFILVQKAFYPIAVLCRVLDVSRSGFHAWVQRPASSRAVSNRNLAVEVVAIHRESRCTYGSPRVVKELRANGQTISRKRVARVMNVLGIKARTKRRFKQTTDSNHNNPIAPNVLDREFSACEPNRAWVTDVKAIWTGEGWLYIAPVIDLFSRKVVGLAMRDSNDTNLALAAFNSAVDQRCPSPGLIHHSDRGSPYASERYRGRLAELNAL
jgi:transposase InsO family protein